MALFSASLLRMNSAANVSKRPKDYPALLTSVFAEASLHNAPGTPAQASSSSAAAGSTARPGLAAQVSSRLKSLPKLSSSRLLASATSKKPMTVEESFDSFAKSLLAEQRVFLPSEADALIMGTRNNVGLVDACGLEPGGDLALLLLESLLLEHHPSRSLFSDAFVRVGQANLAAALRLDRHAQRAKTKDSAFRLAMAIAGDRREVVVMLLGESNMPAYDAFCASNDQPSGARPSSTTPTAHSNSVVSSVSDDASTTLIAPGPVTWEEVGPLDNDESQGFAAFQVSAGLSALGSAARPISSVIEDNPLRLSSARRVTMPSRLVPLSAYDEAVALLETTYAFVGREELALSLANLDRSIQTVTEARRRLVRAHLDDMLACRDAVARLSAATAQGLAIVSAAHRDLVSCFQLADAHFTPLLAARDEHASQDKARESRERHSSTLELAGKILELTSKGAFAEAIGALLECPPSALATTGVGTLALARMRNREAAKSLVALLRTQVQDQASEEACGLLLQLRLRHADVVGEDPTQLLEQAKHKKAEAEAQSMVQQSRIGEWTSIARLAVQDLTPLLRPSELGGHAKQRLRTCVASLEQHAAVALELAAVLLPEHPELAIKLCSDGEVRIDALACLAVAELAGQWSSNAPACEKLIAQGLIATPKSVQLASALPECDAAVSIARALSQQCVDTLALTLELQASCLPCMDVGDGTSAVSRVWTDIQNRLDLIDALQTRAGPPPSLARVCRALGNFLGRVAEQSRSYAAQQPTRFLDLAAEVTKVKSGVVQRLQRSNELVAQVERLESALVTQFLKASAQRIKSRVDSMVSNAESVDSAAAATLGVSDDAMLVVLDIKQTAKACDDAVGPRFASKVRQGLAKVAAERAVASPSSEASSWQRRVDLAFCASHFDAFKVAIGSTSAATSDDYDAIIAAVTQARRATAVILRN